MRLRKTTRTAGALLAAIALAATACGGNGDTGGEGTETDTGTGTGTTTEAPTGAESPMDGDESPTAGETAAGDFDLVSEGTLTVCSDIPYPPFEMEGEGGEFTGFDIDLINAIAGELGLDTSVVVTGFDGIQSGAALAADQCDVAASAMTITDDREENLDFSEPYFEANQSLLVQADGGISSLEDLADGNIGVQSETTGAAYAEENAPDGATITEFSTGADAITALQAGQVDAVLQDLGPNADAASQDESLEVIETYPTDESYGFAVAEEGSDDLLAAINEALATLRDNGTYDEIYNQYFPEAE